MMNRRQFMHTTAVGAVTFIRGPGQLTADYDLVIKGGRVIAVSYTHLTLPTILLV